MAGCMLALAIAPSSGSAQLDEAHARLASAEFEQAVRAFDRAEQRQELDRDDLIALYEGRAMALWALGEEARARQDLAALGSLEPDHELAPEAPPTLRRAFDDLPRERLRLEAEWDDAPGRTTLRLEVRGDVAGVTRNVRAHVRRGDGPWTTEESTSIDLDLLPDERVEAWAELLGPGGAVVARAGSASQPLRHGESFDVVPSRPSEDLTPLWIGLGAGGGVVVLVILIAAIAASVPNDATQPSLPIVLW